MQRALFITPIGLLANESLHVCRSAGKPAVSSPAIHRPAPYRSADYYRFLNCGGDREMFFRNGGMICDDTPDTSGSVDKRIEVRKFAGPTAATQLSGLVPGAYTRWEGTGIDLGSTFCGKHRVSVGSQSGQHAVCSYSIPCCSMSTRLS